MPGGDETQVALPAGKLPPALLGRLLATAAVDVPSVVVGPGVGRDAAVLKVDGDLLVVKSDPITFATDRAAEHLVHINANDLACMGAVPRWLLVTALFPEGATTTELVERTFDDLTAACRRAGVVLVGGHTEVTVGLDRPILVGSMLGEVAAERLIDPSAARPGDRLLLTRSAGIEGTAVLAAELGDLLRARLGDDLTARARRMLDDPGISIVREAGLLSDAGVVTALHDPTEGGVATAVHELATAAGAGAIVARERIPVAEPTAAVCGALGLDPLGFLSSGALLAAVPRERSAEAEAVLDAAGVPWSWIGKLTPPGTGLRLREGSSERELPIFSTDEVARALSSAGGDA